MSKLSVWKTMLCLWLACVVWPMAAHAQIIRTLVNFNGTDGNYPVAPLVQGLDGNLYGTNSAGGANGSGGTVFKITPAGQLTTLYSFCSQSHCTDGYGSLAGLVLATNGNFYGTTALGGASDWGTVFKITPTGQLTTLYSFCSQSHCTDGAYPLAGLVQGTDGNFYGTTWSGGTNQCYDGCGTIFKITPTGQLTTLYSFCSQTDCPDGSQPGAKLIQAANGNFYGTTSGGGVNGWGTVFKIMPAGRQLTTLYSFCSQTDCADGAEPYAGLIQASNGNFYGTTLGGGINKDCFPGCGTAFEITSQGRLTTIHSFYLPIFPSGELVQATSGNLWGTTRFYRKKGRGTVFGIKTEGKLVALHVFHGTDGAEPYAALMQATSGNFYGTTLGGGSSRACHGVCGTVFTLSTGLGPFAKTLPTSGKVGAAVIILGNNLTGTTSVTFNGTPATFTVVSDTEITTTVPSGATTGKVQVTTPGGTLTSNMKFNVS